MKEISALSTNAEPPHLVPRSHPLNGCVNGIIPLVTLILNVQAGSLVFLDCGCQGHRMPSRPDAPVLVIVERPCEAHLTDGRPQPRYLDSSGTNRRRP
jgi:hypothetical protein